MGKTIVISSHILEDLEEICDRVAVIEAGRVVALGDVTTLKDEARQSMRYIVVPRDEPEAVAARLAKHTDVIAEAVVEARHVLITPADGIEDEGPVLKAVLDEGIRLRAFREEVPDLHDIFLELTSGEVS